MKTERLKTKEGFPKYLEDIDLWKKKIEEEIEAHRYSNTLELLGNRWLEKFGGELTFERIPMHQRATYAETASRVMFGLMNEGGMFGVRRAQEAVLYEIRRLFSSAGGGVDDGVFVHLVALHTAQEYNTNTSGASDRHFSALLEKAISENKKIGQQEIIHSLINPFRLSDGDIIFKANHKTGKIEEFAIEVLIEDGEGLVVFGEGETGQEDLKTFNQKLSRGMYMKKEGDNRFGGLELLKKRTPIHKLQKGSHIKIDRLIPGDIESSVVELTILDSNQRELEQKYGQAYLGFFDKLEGKSLLTVDTQADNGNITKNVNVGDLKIVE